MNRHPGYYDKKYNLTGWTLPNSTSDCKKMIFARRVYPTFIDEEYRCGGGEASIGCAASDWDSVHECYSFVASPNDFLGEYFDETPYVPKSLYDCRTRDRVRRMDFTEGKHYNE